MPNEVFINAFQIHTKPSQIAQFGLIDTKPETSNRVVRFRIAANVAKQLTKSGVPTFSVGPDLFSTKPIEGLYSTDIDLEGTSVHFETGLEMIEKIQLSTIEQGSERLVNKLVDWYFGEKVPKSFHMENANFVGENLFAKLESRLYAAFKVNVNEGLLRATRLIGNNDYLLLDPEYRVTWEQSLWDEVKAYAKNNLNADVYLPSAHTVSRINEKYGKVGDKRGVWVQGRNKVGEYEVIEFDFTKNPLTPDTVNGMSQLDFFSKVYNRADLIKDKQQPLVKVRVARGYHFGKMNYHVPELLEFDRLPPYIKENGKVSAALANIQKPPPRGRFAQILNFVQGDPFGRTKGFSGDEFVNEFVSIDRSPVLSNAKTLDPIRVKMGGKSFAVESDKDFLNNILKSEFHRGATIENLWLVCTGDRRDEVIAFYLRLREDALAHGLILPENPTVRIAANEALSAFLEVLVGADSSELVITFGSSGNDDLYDSLKNELLVKYGTLSQHVTYDKTLDRIRDYESLGNNIGIKAIVANLVMQICAKAGGAPWAFEQPIYKKGCPIIGLDVTQTADSERFVAACAVFDDCGEYLFSQPSREPSELVQGLSVVLLEALQRYEAKFGKPSDLFIVREGLNYTQERKFLLRANGGEISVIEDVLHKQAIGNYVLTMEKKNTHLRMFKRITDVRVDNPESGTVVIGSPFPANEMLMVSHEVKQGTIDPIHYKVIKPGNPEMDRIAHALFKLSRHHWNTPRAIRTPAPAFHANQITYLIRRILRQSPRHQRVLDRPFYL